MNTKRLSNKIDRGTLHCANDNISGISFVGCGLSLGVKARSSFRACTFSNIEIKKCSVGFPIFDSCHFENVRSDRGKKRGRSSELWYFRIAESPGR